MFCLRVCLYHIYICWHISEWERDQQIEKNTNNVRSWYKVWQLTKLVIYRWSDGTVYLSISTVMQTFIEQCSLILAAAAVLVFEWNFGIDSKIAMNTFQNILFFRLIIHIWIQIGNSIRISTFQMHFVNLFYSLILMNFRVFIIFLQFKTTFYFKISSYANDLEV